MGRGKIVMERIAKDSKRQVTFSKRRGGLMKKAKELATLCDAQVATIIFSSTGKLYEFASCSMEDILGRYQIRTNEAQPKPNTNGRTKEVEEQENAMPEMENNQSPSKDVDALGLNELQELEEELKAGLIAITRRKEQLVLQQQQEPKVQKYQAQNRGIIVDSRDVETLPQATVSDSNGYPVALNLIDRLRGEGNTEHNEEGINSS